jgi:enhancing lycopene biosynthesis protein 2
MAKVGVVLSGCGVYAGAEIHEATLTLLYLAQAGAEVVCMAPGIPQMHVVDHTKGEPAEGESRCVLVESSRIARGQIQKMDAVKAGDIDALIFPGGFGAAKNLCDFAVKGPDCKVDPSVAKLVNDMAAAKKPMGFECIAPAIVAKLIKGVKVTIGTDKDTAAGIEKMGAKHADCGVDGIVVDEANKVVTTPAYMLGPGIADVAKGIEKLVRKVVELAG